jgi:hypothetical protein
VAGLSIDSQSLRRAAAGIQGAADDLDEVLTRFAGALGNVGDPWGSDMLGSLIGGGYVAIEELALKTYDSVVEGFDAVAEGLTSMAASYDETEDQIGGDFGALDRRL